MDGDAATEGACTHFMIGFIEHDGDNVTVATFDSMAIGDANARKRALQAWRSAATIKTLAELLRPHLLQPLQFAV